jgi:hypothetical protein
VSLSTEFVAKHKLEKQLESAELHSSGSAYIVNYQVPRIIESVAKNKNFSVYTIQIAQAVVMHV